MKKKFFPFFLFQLSEEGFCSHWKTHGFQLFQLFPGFLFHLGTTGDLRKRPQLEKTAVLTSWGLPEAARRAKIPAIKQKILERLKVGDPGPPGPPGPLKTYGGWLLAMEKTMVDMVLLFPWRIRKIWNSHDLLDDSYWNVSIKSGEHVWSSQQNWEVNHGRLWLIISRTKMTSMQIGWWKTILSKLKTHAYSQGQTVGVGMVL